MAEPDYQLLADAIYRAEGGAKARKPYGILSVPVKDEAEARRVAINTARNNYARWQAAGEPGDYLNFLADRFVPASADPRGNVNWKSNVARIYDQLSAKEKKTEDRGQRTEVRPDPLLLRPLPPVNYPMFPAYPLVKR